MHPYAPNSNFPVFAFPTKFHVPRLNLDPKPLYFLFTSHTLICTKLDPQPFCLFFISISQSPTSGHFPKSGLQSPPFIHFSNFTPASLTPTLFGPEERSCMVWMACASQVSSSSSSLSFLRVETLIGAAYVAQDNKLLKFR